MVQVSSSNKYFPQESRFFIVDYIVPPQENNALFLMTNFIRTDQEHKRCPGNIP